MKKIALVLFFICGLAVGNCLLSWAEEKQWSGAGDGASWQDSSNWFPATVPAAGDEVNIDAAGARVSAAKTFYSKSVTVGGRQESSFTIENFIYGTIIPARVTDNALYIRKDGTVIVTGAASVTLKGILKNSDDSLVEEPAFMFGAE